MHDTDGEFLLIEAAAYLPTWLSPDTSQHRVYVYKGVLHIIPMPTTPGMIGIYPPGTPSHVEAVLLVCGEHPTEASPEIRGAVMARVNAHPMLAMQQLHRARCFVPRYSG